MACSFQSGFFVSGLKEAAFSSREIGVPGFFRSIGSWSINIPNQKEPPSFAAGFIGKQVLVSDRNDVSRDSSARSPASFSLPVRTENPFCSLFLICAQRCSEFKSKRFVLPRKKWSPFHLEMRIWKNWVRHQQNNKKGSNLIYSGPCVSQAPGCVNRATRWWEKSLKPNMAEINSAQELVDSLLCAGDRLVVVDFYSPGCGGCRALHPKVLLSIQSRK